MSLIHNVAVGFSVAGAGVLWHYIGDQLKGYIPESMSAYLSSSNTYMGAAFINIMLIGFLGSLLYDNVIRANSIVAQTTGLIV